MSPRHRGARCGARTAALTAAALIGAAVLGAPARAEAQDAGSGARDYQARCGGCHSLDANRVGPAHRGVVGRAVATAPGYAYSPALRRLGGVWTPKRLDQWLRNPQALAPGSKMYLSVPDAAMRTAIIDYLASAGQRP